MNRDTILIPVLMVALIVGIYFGAVIILTNLSRAYTSTATGTIPVQSLIATQVSTSAALITSIGTLLIGLVIGLLVFPSRRQTS